VRPNDAFRWMKWAKGHALGSDTDTDTFTCTDTDTFAAKATATNTAILRYRYPLRVTDTRVACQAWQRTCFS